LTPRPTQPDRTLAWTVIALLVLLSSSALYGGYLLAVDPTGQRLQMSTQLLAGTPFTDFRVPGLFLLVVLGVGALIPIFGHVARTRWSVFSSLVVGLTLLCWIVIQVALVGYISWLQPVFAAVGVAIAALSYAYSQRIPRKAS